VLAGRLPEQASDAAPPGPKAKASRGFAWPGGPNQQGRIERLSRGIEQSAGTNR